MGIPAIVTAGDRGGAKAVHGQSKIFLEVAGESLVARVVETLQRVPEISEVWVVGDEARLRTVLSQSALTDGLSKPLQLVEQFRDLYQNAWQTYRRSLPGAPPDGRDPEGDDLDFAVLYVSGDLPFATPHEISQFIQRSQERGCDYAVGLVTEASMAGFAPVVPGDPGIEMACFNLREGRFRPSNLHYVKPGRLGNRHYIEDMYEHRHQKELGQILGLAWTLLVSETGGLGVLYYYALMHVAGLADRRGWRRLADWIRRFIPTARIEKGCSGLLDTDFAFVVTDIGGCAVDIDNEHDYQIACENFERWYADQLRVGESRHPRLVAGSHDRAGDSKGSGGTEAA
jgi:GTP:adenosylcobinamide-phosphate guanylyltransferase